MGGLGIAGAAGISSEPKGEARNYVACMTQGPTPPFEGEIATTFAHSTPWWPTANRAPAGSPNIVFVLADDMGWSDPGCFGGEIDTPNIDRLADSGLRYTNFHVNPVCSPSRASLLTGVNAHAAGVGFVLNDPGFPGYSMELSAEVMTIAEVLRDRHYTTLMVGKWHLVKETDHSAIGPRHGWPLQRGFDRWYGSMSNVLSSFQPDEIYVDNHVRHVDRFPDDYFYADDLTDHAIEMIRETKSADPTQPFFLYFSHSAPHAPLQAPAADMAKYRGRYEAGWDAVREERFERQKALGLFDADTELPPRNSEAGSDVGAWAELDERRQEIYQRYMECYAGMVDNLDQNLGRLLESLEEMGEIDSTIIVFASDNGASKEGGDQGTTSYLDLLTEIMRGQPDEASEAARFEKDWARRHLIGGPQALSHYPTGWAMASSTPFRLYKGTTFAGGVRSPLIISWPALLADKAGQLRRQYAHGTDLMPTLLELVGIERPDQRHGINLLPMNGVSFAASLADPEAPVEHESQYYQIMGHRGFYSDGFDLLTYHEPRTPFGDHEWQLFDLHGDPTQMRDLAPDQPERVKEMAEGWGRAAWANNVYPLDEGLGFIFLQRSPREDEIAQPLTVYREAGSLDGAFARLLTRLRSFEATLDMAHADGDEGVLLSHGDQGGGYILYVENGELRFEHNGYGQMTRVDAGPMPDGTESVRLAVTATEGWRWTVTVEVDGNVAAQRDDLVALAVIAPAHGIDIGIDRASPVSWDLYQRQGPFPYTGTLRSATFTPGPIAPDAPFLHLEVLRQIGQALG